MSKSWLHLFSSNIRPQYEQDVIDLLAAPEGTLYRFRYQHKYLGDAGFNAKASPADTDSTEANADASEPAAPAKAPKSLFGRWKDDELVRTQVVVYYSIQSLEGYHPSAFIPIRFGEVRKTGTDGSICFVDFEVGEYAALSPSEDVDDAVLDSRLDNGDEAVVAYGDDWRKRAIREFSKKVTDELEQHPDDLPRGKSAVIGPDPWVLAGSRDLNESKPRTLSWALYRSSKPAAWQLVVESLARTLSFRDELILRFVDLCCDPDGKPIEVDENGVFAIRGGRTYDLRFSHYHPSLPVDLLHYEVASDAEILKVVGNTRIPIRSRYDTKSVSLHAPHVNSSKETVLRLEPSKPFKGAVIRLRVRVDRDAPRTAGVAAGTASALILVALPGVLQDAITASMAVGLAAAGAAIAAVLAAFGLRRG